MRRALALRMGYPRQLLSRLMSYAEFLDWCRVFAREPFDDRRTFDMPAALVQAALCNVNRGKEQEAVSWTVFMPYRDQREVDDDFDNEILRKL